MRSQAKKGAACRRRYLQSENAAVGVRFDVEAVILDGTAHTAALPAAPFDAPARCDAAGRRRDALGAVLFARCGCAAAFETVLSDKGEPAGRASVR